MWVMLLGVWFWKSDSIKHQHLLSFISAAALEKQLSLYVTSCDWTSSAADVTGFVVNVKGLFVCKKKKYEMGKIDIILAGGYLLSSLEWRVYWALSYLNYYRNKGSGRVEAISRRLVWFCFKISNYRAWICFLFRKKF